MRKSLVTDTRCEKMSRYANARKLGHGQLARDTSDESHSLRDGTRDGNAVTMTMEREREKVREIYVRRTRVMRATDHLVLQRSRNFRTIPV